jgi:hypothetical protein
MLLPAHVRATLVLALWELIPRVYPFVDNSGERPKSRFVRANRIPIGRIYANKSPAAVTIERQLKRKGEILQMHPCRHKAISVCKDGITSEFKVDDSYSRYNMTL